MFLSRKGGKDRCVEDIIFNTGWADKKSEQVIRLDQWRSIYNLQYKERKLLFKSNKTQTINPTFLHRPSDFEAVETNIFAILKWIQNGQMTKNAQEM